ncbi:hypothetical protein AVEN_24782-1 [Araneus ventricosus]|uniref:Uncharacterized protein n=1 Tax=Araneus ventricosus TaxID=182803 RepID=A0A4Y2WFX7_ARAVE|nr:hypothetical protein AVEN_24782-1 [Araneus ventricosus]
MESRFQSMGVLWLGREFYRGKYETSDSSHVWTPDLGEKLDDKFRDFGDEIWDLKGPGIFSIFLLAEEIRLNVLKIPCDATAWRGRLYKESVWMTVCVLIDWDRLGARTSLEFVHSSS